MNRTTLALTMVAALSPAAAQAQAYQVFDATRSRYVAVDEGRDKHD
jgi:hypothetical protein